LCLRKFLREQAAALKNKLRPMLAYLGKLKRRTVQRGFLSGDPLLDSVVQAERTQCTLCTLKCTI
jgi:hypothetical protein